MTNEQFSASEGADSTVSSRTTNAPGANEQVKIEPGVIQDNGEIGLDVDSADKSIFSDRVSTGYTITDPNSVTAGGRTFQGYRDGAYFLPNDGAEQDRLDLQHHIFEMLLDGKLGLAPIARGIPREPEHVLDVATGTGLWAFEFADRHPTSNVIGTDLSLIQPSLQRILPNVQFVREDSEEPWIFAQMFDYVHFRAVSSCFRDFKTVIRHAYDHLKEGGWIEFQEGCAVFSSFDGTSEGTELQRYAEVVRRGVKNLGGGDMIEKVQSCEQWLREAGFVDVGVNRFSVPTNPWPRNPKFKELGKYNYHDMSELAKAGAVMILPAAGLSKTESDELLHNALLDLGNNSIHAYVPVYFVYGRKPYSK